MTARWDNDYLSITIVCFSHSVFWILDVPIQTGVCTTIFTKVNQTVVIVHCAPNIWTMLRPLSIIINNATKDFVDLYSESVNPFSWPSKQYSKCISWTSCHENCCITFMHNYIFFCQRYTIYAITMCSTHGYCTFCTANLNWNRCI